MNTTNTHTPTRATSLDVEELREIVRKQGWSLQLGWYWQGRVRHGILNVIDPADSSVVYAVEFPRATLTWTKGDEELTKVRTGSPKHQAILSALAYLRSYTKAVYGLPA